MALNHVVLGLLAEGPQHGYDLKRAHDVRFAAARPLAFGQVYATLGRLERDGFVERVGTDQDQGPERVVFALTEAGRRVLDEWLADPEEPHRYAADELVRKTVTALALGADASRFLRTQRVAHLEVMRLLLAEQDAVTDVAHRIALDHTIAHLDADLRWLESAHDRVTAERNAS
ncbi:PadR family transcriptional regulator [Aeromicrobium massiliense]|uniref:PadR family transcriptional regulator n=1 Tax=Aeromicrobium massiliense TaxID=1464554 RepID=UPI00031351E5|nr:PadR family transcriptional regulator [Aeromicrobium massiliense]